MSNHKYDHDAIMADLRSGLSDKEVSKLHACPLGTLRGIRRKHGITRHRKKFNDQAIIEDRKSMSVEEVAKKHGCSKETVFRVHREKKIRESITNTEHEDYLGKLNVFLEPYIIAQSLLAKRNISMPVFEIYQYSRS